MFIKPSTRNFYREAHSSPNISLFDFFHGYFYSRWPYFYISVSAGEHPLARIVTSIYRLLTRLFGTKNPIDKVPTRPSGGNGVAQRPSDSFADAYHGKVVPLDEARKLVTVNQNVTLKNLEHVVPYPVARDIVLQNPDSIAVLQCPCRTARKNPCTPLDVCLIVGEPFAGFMLEHHPEKARRITPAEAVEVLRAEDQRGHVHHAFFKDAMLGRFYAICNCCKCCCAAMQAHRGGTPMLAASGYTAVVDQSLCVACRTCEKYCQFEAVTYIGGKKSVDHDRCFGCGVCVQKCPQGAVALKRDPTRGIPLELDALMSDATAMTH